MQFAPPAVRPFANTNQSLTTRSLLLAQSNPRRYDPGPGWSQSKAEKAFFDRLAKEDGRQPQGVKKKNGAPSSFRRVLPIAPESTWRHVWMLYAAGILLFVTLCLSAYWVGVRHGTDVAKSTPPLRQLSLNPRQRTQPPWKSNSAMLPTNASSPVPRSPSVTRPSRTFAGNCSSSRQKSVR